MHRNSKIATCCYCGQRSVLSLEGRVRHELACASCGAPIRRLKNLRAEDTETSRRAKQPRPARPVWTKPRKRRKPKRLAARFLDLAEEVFDAFD